MKKIFYLLILLMFMSQSVFADITTYRAVTVTGGVLSLLALGYSIAGIVVGSLPQSPQHLECDNDQLLYCSDGTNGTRVCGNMQLGNQTAVCIRNAPWKNPAWANNLLNSGLVMIGFSAGGVVASIGAARDAFSRTE